MQSSILLLWLSVLPMLASAGDPPPLSKSERTGTTNGHWWVEKGDFGPADYWQLIDPHRKVTPSVQEFLKNEYMEVDVKPACRNINCTALLIKVEFAISHKERITFEFNMVRQSLFVENKNIKDYFDLDCWFQQYNPLFGLEDYLRNNYRYVEKVAVAHYCFKRPSDYKRDFTLFFTYHDSYHFQRNGDVPDLLFHIEYLQDMRKFYAFQVLNPILKAWPSIQWEDISPEIERKKLYIKGTKLSPMLLTYDQEIILGPGDSPTTADAYHYDFLMTRAKLANLFNFHRRGPIGQQKKFVPYFKVLLVYRNFLNPIPKKWLDSEHNIVNLLYQADLMLRRLGIRFVVADQFVTSELFPNKPEFSEDNFCRTDALNDMPFSPIDHLFKYLEDTTKELNIDPFTFNAVLYIDPLFNNCDPKEMRKRYADTMQRRIGSKLAWLYSPTHPGRDISSDSTARPNVPAHTIYGLVKTLMFGNYKESTMCVFDGCPRHLVGQMYNANYASLRWDTHVFKEYEKRVPFYRSWLQPPPEYRWTESYQLCGDGLLQGEERCECNPNGCYYYSKSRQGVYRSTCCNRHTCKLNRGSSCGSGMCCDDESCSLIADEKHECRPPKDSCDAAEFCDGDNEECPPDLKWANGHSCDNGK